MTERTETYIYNMHSEPLEEVLSRWELDDVLEL